MRYCTAGPPSGRGSPTLKRRGVQIKPLAIPRSGDDVVATADAILIAIACWVGLSIVLGLLIGRGLRILGRPVPDPISGRVSAAGTRAVARSSLASAGRTRAPRRPAAPTRAAADTLKSQYAQRSTTLSSPRSLCRNACVGLFSCARRARASTVASFRPTSVDDLRRHVGRHLLHLHQRNHRSVQRGDVHPRVAAREQLPIPPATLCPPPRWRKAAMHP